MASRSRVLVTGAGGFTGRHLCALLRDRGHDVVAVTEADADLTDPARVRDVVRDAAPRQVVHLAAISFPGHARADEIYRVNLIATLALLQGLRDQGHGQDGILLPSTAAVYAPANAALTESSALAPGSHYAVSKLAMEEMARVFAGALPITIVRPFNYTGPGQREPFLVPKIVRHFAQRTGAIELGNVEVERDFTDVRTVVDAYARLLAAPAARGLTLNLCSGRAVKVRAIVERLEAITGQRMEIRVNPAFVRPGEPARIAGSAARLVSVIGPLREVTLDATLADMLAES